MPLQWCMIAADSKHMACAECYYISLLFLKVFLSLLRIDESRLTLCSWLDLICNEFNELMSAKMMPVPRYI